MESQTHQEKDATSYQNYICEGNGEFFVTTSGLTQQHVHTQHRSVKPFVCGVCSRLFTQFSNLCRHKLTDCSRKVTCSTCGDTFNSFSARNKHQKFCVNKYPIIVGPTFSVASTVPSLNVDYPNTHLSAQSCVLSLHPRSADENQTQNQHSLGSGLENSRGTRRESRLDLNNPRDHFGSDSETEEEMSEINERPNEENDEEIQIVFTRNEEEENNSSKSNRKETENESGNSSIEHENFDNNYLNRLAGNQRCNSNETLKSGDPLLRGANFFECKFCHKGFRQLATLNHHLKTHTGEQPYVCKLCNRAFKVSGNLERHVTKFHNKEKAYKCKVRLKFN